MQIYELWIGDPWDFEGPDGQNRILAEGVGVVRGPNLPNWQKEDFLLRVINPFEVDGEKVEQLLASPRHTGFTIEDIKGKGCHVGIGRVRGPRHLVPGDQYERDDVKYWAIGSIKRINA